VNELNRGKEPVLAQSLNNGEIGAAVLDEKGKVLAGDIGGTGVFRGAKKLIESMIPGQPLVAVSADKRRFLLDKQVGEKDLNFWKEALTGREEAWGAWLLTMTFTADDSLRVVRHLLAAHGPWTTPELPPDAGEWSLMPLNAALGRLFVFGDDEVAFETAALGGRIGLKVTLVTPKGRDVRARSLQNVGSFKIESVDKWKLLDSGSFERLGLKTGVFVLVTTKDNSTFLADMEKLELGWFGLAGEAAPPGTKSGIFPQAQSPAQKALGIITEMLGNA
jgi:hypothetical protein